MLFREVTNGVIDMYHSSVADILDVPAEPAAGKVETTGEAESASRIIWVVCGVVCVCWNDPASVKDVRNSGDDEILVLRCHGREVGLRGWVDTGRLRIVEDVT